MHGIMTGMIRYFEPKAEFEHHVYQYGQKIDPPLFYSRRSMDECPPLQ